MTHNFVYFLVYHSKRYKASNNTCPRFNDVRRSRLGGYDVALFVDHGRDAAPDLVIDQGDCLHGAFLSVCDVE